MAANITFIQNALVKVTVRQRLDRILLRAAGFRPGFSHFNPLQLNCGNNLLIPAFEGAGSRVTAFYR